MSNLYFDREKQNIGGVNEFSFILESSLNAAIEIIKGQATTFDISTDFIVPRLVNGSIKFAESKRNINLFEYSVSARVAQDDYEKLQDAIMFDTNRIIAIVKDNNGHRRLLGQLNNACELTINFDKGTQTADLNHYAIELRWTSKYRAAIVAATYVVPQTMALENGSLISYEEAVNGNKLSGQPIATTIKDGFVYLILPDEENPGDFKSYQLPLEFFIPTSLSPITYYNGDLLELTDDGYYYTGLLCTNLPPNANTDGLIELRTYPDYRYMTFMQRKGSTIEIWYNVDHTVGWSGWYNELAAAKAYADTLVVRLWDDRGGFDASVNVFPSTNGSGNAGAILRGDIYDITVAGTLGGISVIPGQTVRALVDSPGQTAGNWAISVGSSSISFASESDMQTGTNTTKAVNPLGWVQGFIYHVANYVFSALDTTSNNIIGAINEIRTLANGKLSDAASDGNSYGRKDGAWAIVDRLKTFSTTATAAATTTLTVASNYMQYFTGTLTQIVQMPVVSTLVLGFQFKICNKSTGLITVNSSGSNLICLVPAGMEVILTCIAITGTGAASWSVEYKLPALGNNKAWKGNSNNIPTETDVVAISISVGDFTGAYSGLATESNWTDNVCVSVSGTLGDRREGVGTIGASYVAEYTQGGWVRTYIDRRITLGSLITALQSSGNWTSSKTYNAAAGDLDQTYIDSNFVYNCIDGINHTWYREDKTSNSAVITDASFFAYPQLEVGKLHGDSFAIPAKADIISIIVEAETTTAGNLTIGSTGTQEVAQLVVSAACSANGNAQVVLDGVTFNVPLTTAQNTINLVATAIRNFSFSGWATGGTTSTITFTSTKFKTCTDATYSANGTGATGTMTTTAQGVDPNADIVASTALPTTVGVTKKLLYIENVNFPTTSSRTVYIGISSAASVKLHIINQKQIT